MNNIYEINGYINEDGGPEFTVWFVNPVGVRYQVATGFPSSECAEEFVEKRQADDALKRHGGPYDRGNADAYYGRGFCPHYFLGATARSERVEERDMTPEQLAEYKRGFNECDDFKDWGEHD